MISQIERILVIDDSIVNRNIIEKYLDDYYLEIYFFTNPSKQ